MAALTINITIDQNGMLMSIILTLLVSLLSIVLLLVGWSCKNQMLLIEKYCDISSLLVIAVESLEVLSLLEDLFIYLIPVYRRIAVFSKHKDEIDL